MGELPQGSGDFCSGHVPLFPLPEDQWLREGGCFEVVHESDYLVLMVFIVI